MDPRPLVVATTSHDTAAAVAAIPGFDEQSIFISVGTNMIVGIETNHSLATDEAFAAGLKNEGGFDRKIIIYRDFAAFWLINELMASWRSANNHYTYDEIDALAQTATSRGLLIDPEAAELNLAGGDMRVKINRVLMANGQPALTADADFIRCVYDSLAAKTTAIVQHLQQVTQRHFTRTYVISGGSRNAGLCQLLATHLHLPVLAGLPYASMIGNLLTQFYASGQVPDLPAMRALSGRSFTLTEFKE